jgi:CheY-like chemotaxis protein
MAPQTTSMAGTVLVIDDEAAVTGSIQAILKPEGYEVHVADGGQKGIALAEQIHPDLIILDIKMPDLDGYQTAERLKQIPVLKAVPIIFLTGKTASEDGGMAFARGGASFVRKPFSSRQLRDLVALAMQSISECTVQS